MQNNYSVFDGFYFKQEAMWDYCEYQSKEVKIITLLIFLLFYLDSLQQQWHNASSASAAGASSHNGSSSSPENDFGNKFKRPSSQEEFTLPVTSPLLDSNRSSVDLSDHSDCDPGPTKRKRNPIPTERKDEKYWGKETQKTI